MDEQITINKSILLAIYNTLGQVEYKGRDNADKMYGIFRTIEGLLQPKVGEEDGNNQ